MATAHTHPKHCADQKDAAADRKSHAALAAKREAVGQELARAEWFDWIAATGRAPRPRALTKS
jgi:hypothetical protein